MQRVTVLGSGSWGTALAVLLARNGHEVTLAGRNEEEIQTLRSRRENLRYLPGFAVPNGVLFQMLGDEPSDPDLTVIAVPSAAVRSMGAEHCANEAPVILCSKGLEPGTSLLLNQVVAEERPSLQAGVLSGPNLALEIVRGIPTVAITAFPNTETAVLVQETFSCGTFRVSVSDDLVGIELAGALKNVLAIGAGMTDGLGFGDNTKGAFLSRGLMEMARLGSAMGAKAETFLGPAGAGDLFATASSLLSRNYRLGQALGSGTPTSDAVEAIGQIVEGVPTSDAVQALARREGVEMPVFAAVDAVIKGRIAAKQGVGLLMDRNSKMSDFA